MKFTDGNWLVKEGYDIFSPITLYDYEEKENSLNLYAPYQYINHRGDTLQGPLFTIKLSSPMEDVIRVRFYHYKGQINEEPAFEIAEDANTEFLVDDKDESLAFKSGDLNAFIDKNNFSIEFSNKNGKITSSTYRNKGYIKEDNGNTYIREQLDLAVGECVYGLGERFTEFVKNGQVVDIWNKDGGTSSEQAYKNIPFYLTNKGYGVFVNHPEKVSFEIASERVDKVQFSVPGEYLDYYIINGPTIKDVIKRYTSLTGKPALPPAWSYGLWLTTSFTTNYDEETVNSFVDGMAERELPLHVFHFDCFWMKEYHWTNFKWDDRVFPDPEGMLSRLKDKGLKISVWINPYIAQRSELFNEGVEQGYLIKNPDGTVWQWDKWQPGMAIVDFTNPDACKWYADKLRDLIKMGVDTFKTDFGERIPTDVIYHDGSDPVKMHNYYPYLYNKVVFDVLKEELGKNKAVVFARSATAGGQKFPVHWGGDCNSKYTSMAESLRGGLSLCLSGFAFWSHDIGGFENTATADVYKRWIAFGLLSSHSRLHGSSSYRVPWLFDEEAVDVLRYFTNLKCRLMPHLYKLSCEANQTGLPVMRAMIMEFEDQPGCEYLDKQYMLGDSLLVAPVFSEKGEVAYYLPEGEWTNFITGENISGARWIQEKHDYLSLPLLARENSIIATGNCIDKVDYDYSDNITFNIFQLKDRTSLKYPVYNRYGKKELELSVERIGNKVFIELSDDSKPCFIKLINTGYVQEIDGGVYQEVESESDYGTNIIPEKNKITISIRG
ncbi:alpha-xylosidase [Natronospora cellulosivora (SeqCode)]